MKREKIEYLEAVKRYKNFIDNLNNEKEKESLESFEKNLGGCVSRLVSFQQWLDKNKLDFI